MEFLQRNRDITHLSNFNTPAQTSYFLHVVSMEQSGQIFQFVEYMKEKSLPYIIVTGGTNSLFAFENYPGWVIYIDIQWWIYDWCTKILTCSAGDKIWDIAQTLETQYGQNLWHRFIGLPGSIAGAIYGNAGCFWLETESNFLDVDIVDLETWQKYTFSKSDMNFSYRNSRLKVEKKYCILSARFDLSEKREKYSSDVDNIKFREEIQPKWNSCGSFFKNPSKEQSAGFMIEQVWLKWYQLGWAYFSEKHANFLMHNGQWTYQDLLSLIELAQKKVQEKFWIVLEPEVQIIYP